MIPPPKRPPTALTTQVFGGANDNRSARTASRPLNPAARRSVVAMAIAIAASCALIAGALFLRML